MSHAASSVAVPFGPSSRSSSAEPLSRIAGPTALAAGTLMVLAELVIWPFDPRGDHSTASDPVFQTAGVVYLIGFCLLAVTVPAAYSWHARAAGRFGVVGMVAALLGTFLLGGDLWFETFAVPWLADRLPQALDLTPTTLLGLGAISSYGLFALGWALFGLSGLRARVFPRAICCALVVGGLIGWGVLLSPFGAPLGLAVAWLGGWMIRTTPPAAAGTPPVAGVRQQSTTLPLPGPRSAAPTAPPSDTLTASPSATPIAAPTASPTGPTVAPTAAPTADPGQPR